MRHFKAMNTDFYLYELPPETEIRAEKWFRSVESQLSRFRPASELSRLNQASGRAFAASPLLFEAVSEAVRHYCETDGIFNPFMGRVLENAGYRESFELLHKPDPGDSAAATTATHIQALEPLPPISPDDYLELDLELRNISLQPGYSLDLGGFAKGWSAEKMAQKLCSQGIRQGAIDAGGDIIVWGEAQRLIDIADPYQLEANIATLSISTRAGIATSSRVKRRWSGPDGEEMHHLLDPRTRKPCSSDLIQVTAICPTLGQAEVLAKTFLILGGTQGDAWVKEKHPDCAVIAVREDGSIMLSGMAEFYLADKKGDERYVQLVQ
ncbi:FAD:protein FMN transferase [Paenibacillus sp. HN-1]|uniref:FAD:protein FMN transferase n=1 Tax=Paenibacillus TaxID=44249 RepID=UPI001CA81A5D|nr:MULTISPECIES: FAD:protein FMN transferase [Paenibacillus]MBY9078058.1 FAD:protein FMN transferase [Paenibacillus sp. CGMCC 1.18879]MBY9083799.1 FAD:protein FMN transferase [Paenibacillus sinensis]